ncbi:bifunctional transcriptional activator/DNA repair enzyme protein Ada [Clostridia bacterium]|nr:bifunctional transcriptional activator/DNA repair enzyme protein Ada [Clostridia bacterium]
MIDDKTKWEAVINNDSAYDGKFYYAVKSTGVFCKPSCKSKTPLPMNVEYFASVAAAIQEGFRPCKRCRPDLLNYQPQLEIAEDVKRIIDSFHGEREQLIEQLANIGVSPHRLSEIFKEHFGLTPNQYADNLKIQSAKRQLANTVPPILDIAFSLGFDSLSAFYSFFRKHTQMTPKEFRDVSVYGQATLHKYSAAYDSEFGKILISSDGESITGIQFAITSETVTTTTSNRLTDIAAAQLEEYFAHKRKKFDLPIHPAGTEFQRHVWDGLCSVPYGETRNYKQVATAIGNPNASRAVGMANNKNPILVVIPCHRVIGSNGSLLGYAAGLDVKKKLLDLEQQN